MSKPKKMSLREATSDNQICQLGRGHYEWRDWCIMTDGFTVWISKQKMGHARTDHIAIPKAIFDRLLSGYEKQMPCGRWRDGKFFAYPIPPALQTAEREG